MKCSKSSYLSVTESLLVLSPNGPESLSCCLPGYKFFIAHKFIATLTAKVNSLGLAHFSPQMFDLSRKTARSGIGSNIPGSRALT
jgi:hypothetical protein